MSGVWRYIESGATKHRMPAADAVRAVCGKQPVFAWEWLGARAHEVPVLKTRPKCRNCVRLGRL